MLKGEFYQIVSNIFDWHTMFSNLEFKSMLLSRGPVCNGSDARPEPCVQGEAAQGAYATQENLNILWSGILQ